MKKKSIRRDCLAVLLAGTLLLQSGMGVLAESEIENPELPEVEVTTVISEDAENVEDPAIISAEESETVVSIEEEDVPEVVDEDIENDADLTLEEPISEEASSESATEEKPETEESEVPEIEEAIPTETEDNQEALPLSEEVPTATAVAPEMKKAAIPHLTITNPGTGLSTPATLTQDCCIDYEISYQNGSDNEANIIITDTLDPNVSFVDADHEGVYRSADHTVTWTIPNVAAGVSGKVAFSVTLLESAVEAGEVQNSAKVKIGDGDAIATETICNPVTIQPEFTELAPYTGTGTLGEVVPGDIITYSHKVFNYKNQNASMYLWTILDENVEFVSADQGGVYDGTGIKWDFENVPGRTFKEVTFSVKVLESAVNAGNISHSPFEYIDEDYHTVYSSYVENPVRVSDGKAHLLEYGTYEGNGLLGAVEVDDRVGYEIYYTNDTTADLDVEITFPLDANVELITTNEPEGSYDEESRTIIWSLNVPAGETATVSVTVLVLPSAKGVGMISHTAYVQVGDQAPQATETASNYVPEPPYKTEISPYEGVTELGTVHRGDTITYRAVFINYKTEPADMFCFDNLDPQVEFVSCDEPGYYSEEDHSINWSFDQALPGEEKIVEYTVKVREDAIESIEIGTQAHMWVDNDHTISSPYAVMNKIVSNDVPPVVDPQPSETPDPTKAPEPTATPKPAATQKPTSQSPNTGDNSPIAVYGTVMLFSVVIALAALKRKKYC